MGDGNDLKKTNMLRKIIYLYLAVGTSMPFWRLLTYMLKIATEIPFFFFLDGYNQPGIFFGFLDEYSACITSIIFYIGFIMKIHFSRQPKENYMFPYIYVV